MSSVIEIERAIEGLSDDELRSFRQWFSERDAADWDRRFEADVAGGRLDALGEQALKDLRGTMHGSLKHRANGKFWERYDVLPLTVQRLADSAYELLKSDSRHPSLQLKASADTGPFVSASTIARWESENKTTWSGSELGAIASTTD